MSLILSFIIWKLFVKKIYLKTWHKVKNIPHYAIIEANRYKINSKKTYGKSKLFKNNN